MLWLYNKLNHLSCKQKATNKIIIIIISIFFLILVIKLNIFIWFVAVSIVITPLIIYIYSVYSNNKINTTKTKTLKNETLVELQVLNWIKRNSNNNLWYLNMLKSTVKVLTFARNLFSNKQGIKKTLTMNTVNFKKDCKIESKRLNILSRDFDLKKKSELVLKKRKSPFNFPIIDLTFLNSDTMVRHLERKDPRDFWKKRAFGSCAGDCTDKRSGFYLDRYNMVRVFGNVGEEALSFYKERYIRYNEYQNSTEQLNGGSFNEYEDGEERLLDENHTRHISIVPRRIRILQFRANEIEEQVYNLFHETQYGIYLDECSNRLSNNKEYWRLSDMWMDEESASHIDNETSTVNYLFRINNKLSIERVIWEKKKYAYRSSSEKEEDYKTVRTCIKACERIKH